MIDRPADVPALEKACADLEAFLGDPGDPASRISHAKALDLDERCAYPHELVSAARTWGILDWFVAADLGGKAVDVEDGGNLMRLLARRDLTTTTALSTCVIAYSALWVAGTPEQRRTYADRMLSGSRFAWVLSEPDHGSDLLANATRATRTDTGWVLDGEKYLIGNGTLADVLIVHARTSDRPGPASHSVFVVDRRRCRAEQIIDLPSAQPAGIRGFDLSGVRFEGCQLDDDALLGAVGHGLEVVLKNSQMVRTTMNFLALGALDTNLRATVDFAQGRAIFGTTVWQIPYSRNQLAESFADLLAADALTAGAVRALQAAPEQISSWSSVAKYLVPTVTQEAMARTAIVLGASHYLRAGRYGIFQKMSRDVPLTDFADGNTVVNLKNVVAQLRSALDALANTDDSARSAASARMRTHFSLDPGLPPYRPGGLSLFTRGADDVLLSLPDTVQQIGLRGAEWTRVGALGEDILRRCGTLRESVAGLRRDYGKEYAQTAQIFAVAKDYCALFAAASCLQLYAFGARNIYPGLDVPSVAHFVIARMMVRAGCEPPGAPSDAEEVAEALAELHAQGLLFGFRALPLAD